jgi:hypothetical protein
MKDKDYVIEDAEIRTYFHEKYKELNIRVTPGHYPNFKTKEEVDKWIEHHRLMEENIKRLIKGNAGNKRHANEFLRSDTGRLAGIGMQEDDYSEESYAGDSPYEERGYTPIPKKKEKVKEKPVRQYKLSEEELAKYKIDTLK